ncbi:beta-1,3-galactosyltransferase pvg3-like [Canna indica]|uniref:Hexosyltransferase n=1 Tax=Canna indica TaxID=4628 RepID=A0AAQ3KGT3_9LILI|nr:beta-1,3-galactosyltransferase pvg3-like [Canna indica]
MEQFVPSHHHIPTMKKHHYRPSPEISICPKASTTAFLLFPFLLIALIFLVIHPNEFWLQSIVSSGCETPRRPAAQFVDAVAPKPALRIFIGILTRPDTYERRHLLRNAYALQPNLTVDARIDVRFVLCNLTKEEQRVLVALEILRYDDIVILNCGENLNDGKTFTYFSSLPALFKGEGEEGEKPYDYVLKADDDSYVRLDALATTLMKMPREDLYMGFYIPCKNISDPDGWMTGMAYAISWDLVEWIVESDIPRNNKVHHPLGEDVVLAYWFRDGNRGKNRVDMNPRMYDIYVKNGRCYSRPFIPDTIVVHRLKDNARWARTLSYFNVTRDLKLSKFYHGY